MPQLDVSEILLDPDFADTITVVRNVETVDDHGRASLSATTIPDIVAVITQAGGDILDRLPEGARVEGTILIHTPAFRLVAETDATTADTVLWGGRTYTVTLLADWLRYGQGFSAAVCTLKDLAGTAP